MYALFVVSEIDPNRLDEADGMLKGALAPKIKESAGFLSGTWARSPDGKDARSMLLFDSEEAARAVVDSVTATMPADAPVTIKTTSVLEVAHQV